MGTNMRRELEQRIAVERSRLCKDVLAGELEEFDSRVSRLKAYRELLGQIPRPWIRRLAAPLIVAGLTVTLVGLLWPLKKSPTRVLLVAEASGMQIAATEAIEFRRMPETNTTGTQFWITGIGGESVSPGLNLPTAGNGEKSLHLCEGHFRIERVAIDPDRAPPANKNETNDHFLDIQLLETEMPTFSLNGGSAQIDLTLWGKPVRLARGQCGLSGELAAPQVLKQLPETLHVEASAGRARPVQFSFRLDPGGRLTLQHVRVDALRFVRETASSPGQREFVSTIHSANLSLPDSGASESLTEGTFLELDGFVGTVRQIRIGERLEVEAEGNAALVLTGPPGYQRDLTPSYVQYLKRNQQLGLLWGAVVFIWGLLWSGKRLWAG